MRLAFRHLAATTAGLAFVLILLGVYTGAIGAGLACDGRWPFCDGWLGLFPATWPSFVEWVHRLVAVVTGLLILATAITAFRGDQDRRIVAGSVLAVVVLPVQILLGANTVFNFGAFSQVLHHAAAQVIFAALVAVSAWAFAADRQPPAPTGND